MSKVRIGMIGTGGGGIAQLHATQLQQIPEAEIAAIADPGEENRAAFAHRFNVGSSASFGDYREMIDRMDLDAVIICTPHALHYPQATEALNRGLHVLIEKPMTCSSAEAEALIQTAKKSGKVMQASYQRHFIPEFIYIRETIASGEIGKLTSIAASLHQNWWKDGNQLSWRQSPSLAGGGFLMDSGTHILDMLLWTTGLTPVEARMQYNAFQAPVEIDTFSSIRFAEGAIASVNLIGNAPCWHETYVFCGEKGGIFFENGKIRLRRPGQDDVVPELSAPTTNADKSFVDAILGRHEVMVPGEFAYQVAKLSEMIYAAAGYAPYASEALSS